MTHLSDFSFLQRAIGSSYVLIWFIYRLHTTGGFACLRFSKIKQGELKNIVSSKIKYEEGFVRLPTGKIITKPEFLWNQADRDLVIPTDYSLCIGFSLQSGTLLLLQCFWNYLAKLVAKARFMSSKEFKFYIIIIHTKKLCHSSFTVALLLISFLGAVSHFRFKKLLSNSKDRNNAQFITHRIRYFQDLNLILSVSVFIFSLCFVILSADGLSRRKTISRSKFASDVFICNINIMSIVIWVIVILIFHPKSTVDENVPHMYTIVKKVESK
ncbi:hypothetical protein BDF20DRAFT_904117 [Mycotypha africana]|uniref:uncharacterized protein n=1 Tax=Mycotypha africana TaxID=64632 RepID=UPI0022FFC6B0|nr:uncharacterized protein BDF20DRAFT_904117 [Mycotypha africana]KAI8991479.1 hypothetical protein BDF20DRAFT_904117 [Mycotypha africana]